MNLDDFAQGTADGLPNEPEKLRELLLAEREQTAHLRQIIKRRDKRAAKFQAMQDAICETVREHLVANPPTVAVYDPPKRDKRKRAPLEAVLHCSDWQVGKRTETYSTDAAAKQVKELEAKALEVLHAMREAHPVRSVAIYLGGDLVEGEQIFPGQAWEVDSPLYEQATVTAPTLIAGLVNTLLKHAERVRVVGVAGNHGRESKHSHKRTNWDEVAMRCARLMLEQSGELPKRLEWVQAGEWYAIDRVAGWGNLLVHGHQIRGWAGIPHYGIQRKVLGWASSLTEPWDYCWLGHFHQAAQVAVNLHGFLLNGTIETGNEYALEQLAATGWPMQRLAFFSREHGLTYDCPLYLGERESAERRWKGWGE